MGHSMVKRDIFDNPFFGRTDDWFWFARPSSRQLVRSHISHVDVKSVEGGDEVRVVAPGLRKDDFTVQVVDRTLSISYSSQLDGTPRSFERQWQLQPSHSTDGMNAMYEAGVLYVFIPTTQEQGSAITITVK